MKKFEEKYTERDVENQLLASQAPKVMEKFMEIHGEVIKDGAVSKKNKELTALGIAVAVRCEGCILAHVKAAIACGASMEELSETVEVAILMGGGPSTVYGGHALAIATELFSKN